MDQTFKKYKFKVDIGARERIPLLGLNHNKTQTIGNTAVEPTAVTNQPLTKLSRELLTQEVSSETDTPKVIPIEKFNVGTPNNLIIHSDQVPTTSSAIRPTPVQSINSIQNNNTVAIQPILEGLRFALKPTVEDLRFAINGFQGQLVGCFVCNKSATMVCSDCKVAKYCSDSCRQRHWYAEHVFDCKELRRKNGNSA
ncbi:unnamed protein product [Macrosiphum euphorbiae]|uniref:MYND-type domain-containing protein n=1 Tax=Macrosiphum euphorbiae TaxID=13131 RepID=A0AAV0XZE8_9HEMI|nr:unnamed protein product [Macrosiphum euphorbiae]